MRAVACDLLLCLGHPAHLRLRRQQGRTLELRRLDHLLPYLLELKYHCLYRRRLLLQSQSRSSRQTVLFGQTLLEDVPAQP